MQRCRFGETPAQQSGLADLIVRGIKTASCSALLDYHDHPDQMPHPGDRFAVENGAGEIVCVIETTAVRFVRFQDVDADFANAEGEGDRSLAFWRQEHERFFTAEGVFTPDMMLVCEWFRVVECFQPSSAPARIP